MNHAKRTAAWDSVMVKAALQAAACPPSASTHMRALECYGGVGPATARLARPEHHRVRGLAIAVAAFLLAVLVLLIAGCVAPEAIEQARTEAAALHGVAASSSNTPAVRAIAARGELAWDQQHVSLTGDHVPGRETWTPIPAEFLPAAPDPAAVGGAR